VTPEDADHQKDEYQLRERQEEIADSHNDRIDDPASVSSQQPKRGANDRRKACGNHCDDDQLETTV
jgi:hypothetical protein